MTTRPQLVMPRGHQGVRMVIATLLAIAAVSVPVDAQKTPKPSEKELLERVASYVAGYVAQLINIVAEETFEQQRQSKPVVTRRLLSDILLVNKPGSANEWLVFRDVTTVDGAPVPDKEARLVDLFVAPAGGTVEQANRIARDGERFHLPAIIATANPLFMIVILQERYQKRLSFDVGDEAPEFGAGVRILHVDETSYVNRRSRDTPLFSVYGGRGRAWVEVATGRILQTEARLLTGRVAITGINTTTFEQNDRLGLLVPVTMQTTWQDPSTRRDVKGLARYGNYRRFNVNTDTKLQLPPR